MYGVNHDWLAYPLSLYDTREIHFYKVVGYRALAKYYTASFVPASEQAVQDVFRVFGNHARHSQYIASRFFSRMSPSCYEVAQCTSYMPERKTMLPPSKGKARLSLVEVWMSYLIMNAMRRLELSVPREHPNLPEEYVRTFGYVAQYNPDVGRIAECMVTTREANKLPHYTTRLNLHLRMC